MDNNIKSLFTPQIIIYTIVGLGLGVYLFFAFVRGDSDSAADDRNAKGGNAESGKILISNEKPQGKDFFEGYKQRGQERASIAFEYTPTGLPSTNLEDKTDDGDIALIQQALREQSEKPAQSIVYTAPVVKKTPPIQIEEILQLEEEIPLKIVEETKKSNRFFEGKRKMRKGNTLSCVVHGEQEVMNGSTLKLRLLEDFITPDEQLIEKGTTLWGVCSLSKERMLVSIESVLIDKNLIPLNLKAYDLDGLEGINLPNNVKAEIAKRAKVEAIRQTPTDDIIGNNGVLERGAKTVANTTKQLLSRKQEEIKIKVKSNYQLALKPSHK